MAICLVIFGVLILNTKSNDVKVDNVNPDKIITASNPLPDNVFGTKAGKVILVEYGDFQCPACGNLYPSIKPLKEHYKEQLTFIYRDFPLTSIHPNALASATAAEAAGLQGKFWEMHDLLYENQPEWSSLDSSKRTDQFIIYALKLGLDKTKFKKDLENEKIAKKIQRDQALGKKIGATATPTLVLNGETLDQKTEWETPQKLENAIVKAIKASGQTPPEKLNKE